MKAFRRRLWLEAFLEKVRFAQFGQDHDKTTDNGREGCTHTCWQLIIKWYTGRDVTHDELSAIARYTMQDNGMNSGHCDRIIAHFRLPYVASWRQPKKLSARNLCKIAREVGPVLFAVPYGLYPLEAGLADNAPNGEAFQGGRDDLGFAGNHAVLLFSAKWRTKISRYRPRGFDPDHAKHRGIPKFDIYSEEQLARMWNHNLVGKDYGQFAYIPTKELVVND